MKKLNGTRACGEKETSVEGWKEKSDVSSGRFGFAAAEEEPVALAADPEVAAAVSKMAMLFDGDGMMSGFLSSWRESCTSALTGVVVEATDFCGEVEAEGRRLGVKMDAIFSGGGGGRRFESDSSLTLLVDGVGSIMTRSSPLSCEFDRSFGSSSSESDRVTCPRFSSFPLICAVPFCPCVDLASFVRLRRG